MDTHRLKEEIEKKLEHLATLRDEAKVKLHLATLDAKTEWDERLEPRIFEAEQAAKHITEATLGKLSELIAKVEDFVAHLRERKGEHAAESEHAAEGEHTAESEHAPPSAPHSEHAPPGVPH